MKTTFLILCLLCTTAAFAQRGSSVSGQSQPYHSPSHPGHATTHALAAEQHLVGGTSYVIAQGERPMWELPQVAAPSLGDAARLLRKEHAKLKKARFVFEN